MSDDLADLIRDFGKVPGNLGPHVRTALERSARGTKDGWRNIAAAASRGHAKGYPATIDYDVRTKLSHWEAEIGPNLKRYGGRGMQPSLGILEDAPGGVAAAPQKARPRLLKSGEKYFERGMDRAADDALRKAKL